MCAVTETVLDVCVCAGRETVLDVCAVRVTVLDVCSKSEFCMSVQEE